MSDNERTEDSAINDILPDSLKEVRSAFMKHTVPEVDRYGEGFVAQAYFAAKNSTTGSYSSIANTLGRDKLTFQYYMEKYPDFVLAVNMGRQDGKKDRIESIESSLLARALGVEVEESVIEEAGQVDEDGNIKEPYRKVRKVKKQIPPDTQAALEILRRIDPNWNPKQTLEVSLNSGLNVQEDVNIDVDLRELSPDVLKMLLNSNKREKNMEANNTPDGISVEFLGEKGKKNKESRARSNQKRDEKDKLEAQKLKDSNTTRKTRVMSPETREKISQAMKKRYSKEE